MNQKFKSGKKVFDWIVPEEWEINNAYIEHLKTGKKFAEFKKNNLHLVGYSIRKNFITTTSFYIISFKGSCKLFKALIIKSSSASGPHILRSILLLPFSTKVSIVWYPYT